MPTITGICVKFMGKRHFAHSKKIINKWHFQRRVTERLGFEIDNKEYNSLIAKIRRDGGKSGIKRVSSMRCWHEAVIREIPCFVLYDRRQGNLITVLLTAKEIHKKDENEY